MKKTIQQYVKSLGGSTAYSGRERIMYINDPMFYVAEMQSIEDQIYAKYGYDLPFKLITNPYQ